MTIDDDNRLTAWWLGLAPSRQEEALASSTTDAAAAALPWLEESIVEAELDPLAVAEFLRTKRSAIEPTRDAGLNPKPD
jgi:hypothetical protein